MEVGPGLVTAAVDERNTVEVSAGLVIAGMLLAIPVEEPARVEVKEAEVTDAVNADTAPVVEELPLR